MANKNTNYNYKPVSNVLSANNSSGALAVAEDIAYEWTDTTNDALGNPLFITQKTLKAKIEELELNAGNSDKVDELEADVNNIKQSISTLNDSVSAASVSASNALQYSRDAASAKTDAEAAVASVLQVASKVDSLDEIALNLAANLDYDAAYEILTTDAYNQKVKNKLLNANTIYFLYDGIESLKYSIYARPIDDSMGTVTYSGDHINVSKGSLVTITATPKDGYAFAAWKSAATGSESMETVSTNSSYLVTVNADKEYVAWFTISA